MAEQTVDEAAAYLFSEETEADMVAVPPEVDELTNEENIEDEMIGNTQVNDIADTAEIFYEEDWCDEVPTFSFPN
jgi:hypothetical protein